MKNNLEIDKEYAIRLGISVDEYRKRKAEALGRLGENVRIITSIKNTSELCVEKPEETKSRGK